MAPRLRSHRDPALEPPSASSSSEEDDDESEEILLNQKSTDIVTGRGESDVVEDVSESDKFAIQDVSTKSRKSHLQDSAAAAEAAEAILDLAKPNQPLAAYSTRSRKSHLQASAAAGTQERKENGNETPKKKDNASNGVEKSGIYRSLDDEIAMLEEMIDYQQTKGSDPLANAASFYDFIKKNLPNDVSKAKMVDKIKGLKKKYQNIAEDPVSTKPHDLQFLELSRKIWGGNVGIANGSGKKQQKNVEGDNDSPFTPKVKVMEESGDFWAKYPLLERSLMSDKLKPLEIPVLEDVHFVKETMSLIGSSKASELEGKWKKLKMEELELQVKKLKLIQHQNQLMQEAFKSSS